MKKPSYYPIEFLLGIFAVILLAVFIILSIGCRDKNAPPVTTTTTTLSHVTTTTRLGATTTTLMVPTPTPTPVVLKPLKDISRVIQMGHWASMASSKFDMKFYQEAIYPSKYNFTSVHLMSPWGNYEGLYPWPLNAQGTKFDLSKRNPVYYAQLKEYVRQAAINGGQGIEICFLDSYGSVKWRQYRGYGMKLHPLVENTYGIDLVGATSNGLYYNWKKTGFKDSDFIWMAWTADAHDHVLSAHGANKVGAAIMDYIQQVAKTFGDVEKELPGRVRVGVRAINEPGTYVDSNNQYIVGSGTGDDPRVEDWEMQQFQAQGFKLNKNLFMIHEGAVKYQNAAGASCYSCLKKNVDFSQKQGWQYEEHGCDPQKAKEMLAASINPKVMACSTDGVSDHIISDISHELLSIWPGKVEIKFSDDWGGVSHDPNKDFKAGIAKAIEAVK